MILPTNITALRHLLVKGCERAGRYLIRDFNEIENLQSLSNGPGDFVVDSIRNSEQIFRQLFSTATFDHITIANTAVRHNKTAPGTQSAEKIYLLITPIAGINNFNHAQPHFAVSAAAVWQNQAVAAAIFDPIRHEMFSVQYQAGAWLNDRKLKISGRGNLADCMLVISEQKQLAALEPDKVATGGKPKFRSSGCLALDLAYVASGRFDACIHPKVSAIDCWAGALLVSEAGGVCTTPSDKPLALQTSKLQQSQAVIASQPNIHQLLVRKLQHADK